MSPRHPDRWTQQSLLKYYLTCLFCRLCCLPSHLKCFSLCYPVLPWFPFPPPISWNVLFFFPSRTYSSANLENTCLVLHSGYTHLLHIALHYLTVFYALITFTSVSWAIASLWLKIQSHTSLCLLDSSTLTWFNSFPWKKCRTSLIQLAIQAGNPVITWFCPSPSLPHRYLSHQNQWIMLS